MKKMYKNQRELIRAFNDEYREPFNDSLFEHTDDRMIEELEQVILSCQRDKYFMLKVLNFEVIKRDTGLVKMGEKLSPYNFVTIIIKGIILNNFHLLFLWKVFLLGYAAFQRSLIRSCGFSCVIFWII